MATKAFKAGYEDGLQWDLDGFDSVEAVKASSTGWDEATINALGRTKFAQICGVDVNDEDAFVEACAEYNLGAYSGATSADHEGRGPESGE